VTDEPKYPPPPEIHDGPGTDSHNSPALQKNSLGPEMNSSDPAFFFRKRQLLGEKSTAKELTWADCVRARYDKYENINRWENEDKEKADRQRSKHVYHPDTNHYSVYPAPKGWQRKHGWKPVKDSFKIY